MRRFILMISILFTALGIVGCGTNITPPTLPPYESAAGKQIKLTAGNTEVYIILNGTRAAADLVTMLPLELTLTERNEFAKGMTLPRALVTDEGTTRSYVVGDFGYWTAGPDLAIFYDDPYEETIVPIIPLGRAENGAENLRHAEGTVRLELISTP